MDILSRSSFARGWTPSADGVHASPDALLRADNLILDERGVLALRRGSAKINSVAFADVDVHSLFTTALGGTRYRMAGATSAVYANGTSVATGLAGSGDVSFGTYLGQILWARSTTKKKYDGTTVRNWGIAAPNNVVTLAAIAQDGKTFISGDSTESPALTWEEDDATGAGYAAGYDGTANGAAVVNPSASGRARVRKTFAAPTDFTTYDAAQTGLDSDVIGVYVYVTEPQYLNYVRLSIDVNTALFQNDQYYYIWWFNQRDVDGGPISPVPAVGWNFLQVKRSDMNRYANATAGKNWSTVKAVEIEAGQTISGTAAQIRIDLLRIRGGSSSPITGLQRYRLVAVYNSGTYTGKSAPNAASADLEVTSQGVTVTVPAAVVSALDSQVTELWLYRYNAVLGDYYRVAVKTGGPFAGAQTITDTASDEDALTTNLLLETTITTPPDTIVGIAGPHYDRVFALTATHVYPSQPRNLDSFASDQAIRVGDGSETAYWIAKAREELYIGTSKDIYRLVGDWTERADGLVNVAKIPMGVAHPPISAGIAQDADALIYLSAEGWQVLGAYPLDLGDVDLLYRGDTRHGVSPVNLSTGRFRAAVTKQWLTIATPEGASTTSTTVLHRYVPGLQRWYRHTYGRNWRCLYREPDGTLIASDDAGFVWTLDTGTQDDATDLAVVLWTPVEDDGRPTQRKDPWEVSVRANTGGANATVAVHVDGSGSSSDSFPVASSGLTPVVRDLNTTMSTPYRQSQLRVTGSFSTFLWYDYALTYRTHPPVLVFAEPKPETRGTRRRRFAGLTLVLDTLGAAATITPVLDDVAQTAQTVTTSDAVSTALTMQSIVGRDLWATIRKATGFELYGLEANVIAEYPPVQQGRVPDSNAGLPGPKQLTGLRIRACTLGVARTFTPILDGTSLSTTFSATTSADEPDELVFSFSSPQLATDVAFSVDGNIELYDWAPLVDAAVPLGRTLWDSGPIDLGGRAAWIPFVVLKAKLTGDLTVTPYVDDIAQPAITITAKAGNPITTYEAWLVRTVRGRQLRFVLSASQTFHLYWLEPRYRVTGTETDLQQTRVTVAV